MFQAVALGLPGGVVDPAAVSAVLPVAEGGHQGGGEVLPVRHHHRLPLHRIRRAATSGLRLAHRQPEAASQLNGKSDMASRLSGKSDSTWQYLEALFGYLVVPKNQIRLRGRVKLDSAEELS